MQIFIQTIDAATVVTINGELDGKTAPIIQAQLAQACAPGCQIVLDMQHVNYLSSAGLRMLLMLNRQIAGLNGRIVIVGLSSDLIDTLAETGFLAYLQIEETLDLGLVALHKNFEAQDDYRNNSPRADRFAPDPQLRSV